MIKGSKNNVPWTYVIGDLDVEEIVRIFYKNEKENPKGIHY